MELAKEKRRAFFVLFILFEGNLFNICVLSQCIVYRMHFQNIHNFTYQKTLLHTFLLLVFKIVKSPQCILNLLYFIFYTSFFHKPSESCRRWDTFLLFIKLLLHCCSDVEITPGPKQSSLTFCPWNLNDIAAHNFVKISLIQGYITESDIEIICLSETFLSYSLNNKDDPLKTESYHLIRIYIIKRIFL